MLEYSTSIGHSKSVSSSANEACVGGDTSPPTHSLIAASSVTVTAQSEDGVSSTTAHPPATTGRMINVPAFGSNTSIGVVSCPSAPTWNGRRPSALAVSNARLASATSEGRLGSHTQLKWPWKDE